MKIKSERGISTIDITVAIIIITLLLSVIIALSINISSNDNKVKAKSAALDCAINEIEQIKATGWKDSFTDTEGYIENTPYYKIVRYEDAHDINEYIDPDIMKRVTVTVKYRVENKDESISLSAVLIKPDNN